MNRWAWAEIDVAAIRHNVGVMRRIAAPAEVWAVVKADGYGHGAVAVGRAALEAGCAGLCVALTHEGVALRQAGIDAPILVLSEQPVDDAARIVAHRLTPTVTTREGIESLGAVRARDLAVHLKVDTGMHRIGAGPADVAGLAKLVMDQSPWLRLAGVFTHLAIADEPDDPFTAQQLATLDDVISELPDDIQDELRVHAANSAGALAHPGSRRSLVRVGAVLCGISPGAGVDRLVTQLRPAMAIKARVSFVKRLPAGERLSYGLNHAVAADTNVATVPIGYADGVRRHLSGVADVLIGGRRRPIIGSITMDQLMVDCGDDHVERGDEVVLIGRQGAERITAEEWARHLDTISYEITCGITTRVPRILL